MREGYKEIEALISTVTQNDSDPNQISNQLDTIVNSLEAMPKDRIFTILLKNRSSLDSLLDKKLMEIDAEFSRLESECRRAAIIPSIVAFLSSTLLGCGVASMITSGAALAAVVPAIGIALIIVIFFTAAVAAITMCAERSFQKERGARGALHENRERLNRHRQYFASLLKQPPSDEPASQCSEVNHPHQSYAARNNA